MDSDSESSTHKSTPTKEPRDRATEEPIAVPLSRFEPMPKRPKKINLVSIFYIYVFAYLSNTMLSQLFHQ